MHAISGLKTLFGAAVYRLAYPMYVTMKPERYTWFKVTFVCMALIISFLVFDIVERICSNIAIVTVISTGLQVFRWFSCFILAQFVLSAVEDVSQHWEFSPAATMMLFGLFFILLIPVLLPIAIRFGLFWCDCGQGGCLLCQVYHGKWYRVYGTGRTP